MPRKGRKTIDDNIYADSIGYAISVTVRGRREERRFPDTYTLQQLRVARETLRYDLEQSAPFKGTFKEDADAYTRSLPKGSRLRTDREIECARWFKTLGALPRTRITPQLAQQAMQDMETKPRKKGQKPRRLSASSVNKARNALVAVYRFHDGPTATTPLDHIPRPREAVEIRAVPQSVVTMILRNLPRCKTRARLKVLARTGLPHTQIAAIQPHHLDLEVRELTVTPRRKGRGVPPRTLPLSHAAVRAFKEFQRLKAYGPFSRHSMRRMFQEAVTRAQQKWKGRWPAADDLRPYDLRHAFGTEVYRRTKDLRATSELMIHATLQMTARYAEAAVKATAAAARDALDVPRKQARGTLQTPTEQARKSRSVDGDARGTTRRQKN